MPRFLRAPRSQMLVGAATIMLVPPDLKAHVGQLVEHVAGTARPGNPTVVADLGRLPRATTGRRSPRGADREVRAAATAWWEPVAGARGLDLLRPPEHVGRGAGRMRTARRGRDRP